jgi:hypothetical protein
LEMVSCELSVVSELAIIQPSEQSETHSPLTTHYSQVYQ